MTIQEDGFSLGRQSERRVRESWERWYENHLGHESACDDGAPLAPFYAGLPISTKKRSLTASLFMSCLLFYDDIDDSLRYNDDFHDGLAFGEFLDFRKSLSFFADFFARHSDRDGECRADLAVDLDSEFDLVNDESRFIAGRPSSQMDAFFLLSGTLPEFFGHMRNEWREENEKVSDEFAGKARFDGFMGFDEAVHIVYEFHDGRDRSIESKFPIQIFSDFLDGLVQFSSESEFIRGEFGFFFSLDVFVPADDVPDAFQEAVGTFDALIGPFEVFSGGAAKRMKRRAVSAPYFPTISSGETTLPTDLLILPPSFRTMP